MGAPLYKIQALDTPMVNGHGDKEEEPAKTTEKQQVRKEEIQERVVSRSQVKKML